MENSSFGQRSGSLVASEWSPCDQEASLQPTNFAASGLISPHAANTDTSAQRLQSSPPRSREVRPPPATMQQSLLGAKSGGSASVRATRRNSPVVGETVSFDEVRSNLGGSGQYGAMIASLSPRPLESDRLSVEPSSLNIELPLLFTTAATPSSTPIQTSMSGHRSPPDVVVTGGARKPQRKDDSNEITEPPAAVVDTAWPAPGSLRWHNSNVNTTNVLGNSLSFGGGSSVEKRVSKPSLTGAPLSATTLRTGAILHTQPHVSRGTTPVAHFGSISKEEALYLGIIPNPDDTVSVRDGGALYINRFGAVHHQSPPRKGWATPRRPSAEPEGQREGGQVGAKQQSPTSQQYEPQVPPVAPPTDSKPTFASKVKRLLWVPFVSVFLLMAILLVVKFPVANDSLFFSSQPLRNLAFPVPVAVDVTMSLQQSRFAVDTVAAMMEQESFASMSLLATFLANVSVAQGTDVPRAVLHSTVSLLPTCTLSSDGRRVQDCQLGATQSGADQAALGFFNATQSRASARWLASTQKSPVVMECGSYNASYASLGFVATINRSTNGGNGVVLTCGSTVSQSIRLNLDAVAAAIGPPPEAPMPLLWGDSQCTSSCVTFAPLMTSSSALQRVVAAVSSLSFSYVVFGTLEDMTSSLWSYSPTIAELPDNADDTNIRGRLAAFASSSSASSLKSSGWDHNGLRLFIEASCCFFVIFVLYGTVFALGVVRFPVVYVEDILTFVTTSLFQFATLAPLNPADRMKYRLACLGRQVSIELLREAVMLVAQRQNEIRPFLPKVFSRSQASATAVQPMTPRESFMTALSPKAETWLTLFDGSRRPSMSKNPFLPPSSKGASEKETSALPNNAADNTDGGNNNNNAVISFEIHCPTPPEEDVNLNEYQDLMASVLFPAGVGTMFVGAAGQGEAWQSPSRPVSVTGGSFAQQAHGSMNRDSRVRMDSLQQQPHLSSQPRSSSRRLAVHNTFENVSDFPFVSPNLAALDILPVINVASTTPFGDVDFYSPTNSPRYGKHPSMVPLQLQADGSAGGLHQTVSGSFNVNSSVLDGRSNSQASPDHLQVQSPSPMHNRRVSGNVFEASQLEVNHMSSAVVRRATFVVCHLFFPQGNGNAISSELTRDRLTVINQVCQLFTSLTTDVINDFQGVMFDMRLTSIVMTFNAFEPCPFHEARGCLAALHLAKELQERFDSDLRVLSTGAKWGMCVNTGAVVVGIAGSRIKMQPSIVGDAVTIAHTVARLCTIIHCHVLVLEPCYNISRTQVFCVPVDIVGQEGAQIIVFELKGHNDEFRQYERDFQPLMDGFACMAVHKFDEAERYFNQSVLVDHNANRLLELTRWFRQVQGTGAAMLPRPYHRLLPVWDSPEILAEAEDLQDDVKERLMLHRNLLMSPNLSQITRIRRASSQHRSSLPEVQLRNQLERMSFDRRVSIEYSNQPHLNASLIGPLAATQAGGEVIGSWRDYHRNSGSIDVSSFNSRRGSHNSTSTGSVTPLDMRALLPETGALNSTVTWRSAVPNLPVEVVDRKGTTYLRTDKLLGQGAFGAVYQGLAENGSLVAMKILPLNIDRRTRGAALPSHVDEVLREIALLSHFSHANIVQYLTSAICSSYLVIVMEYMPAGNLTRMVSMFGALPLTVIRRFSKDIVEGLRFLHSQSLVHRDINPNNVLLAIDGSCKLSDFGASASILQKRGAEAARSRRCSEESSKTSRSGSDVSALTPQLMLLSPGLGLDDTARSGDSGATAAAAAGKIIGTPIFMAPEACRGQATTASDIWGFGVIMCYCFSGQYPYPEADFQDVETFIQRIATDESYKPTIPRHCISNLAALNVIEMCLERNEKKRPSAQELLMCPFFIL